MLRISEIRLPLEHLPAALPAAVAARLGIAEEHIRELSVFRRSCDARKASAPTFIYSVDVGLPDETAVLAGFADDPRVQPTPDMRYHFVGQAPVPLATRPVVVGFGPAGIFAALILAQSGLRPLVLERGKAVRERTQDTWGLWRRKVLDPESNVQFGEGGAGTFSDGKLYSQIKDPKHYGRKVLEEFVKAGAPAEILYVSKPHIGTFRLVGMVEQMRHEIEQLGGEIRFQQRVDRAADRGRRQLRGVTLASRRGTDLHGDVVLAVGHSARDTFAMLHSPGVFHRAKAVLDRFSHRAPADPDRPLHDSARTPATRLLGAADYKLVHHCRNGRSVYSFCMCPGGTVVAATSEPGPGGDQRHEPVLAQRAQRQRRHRRRHHAARLPRRPLAGIELQRGSKRVPSNSAADLRGAGAARR
jgi:uncharacterized FAD-dependent dehydrogenase